MAMSMQPGVDSPQSRQVGSQTLLQFHPHLTLLQNPNPHWESSNPQTILLTLAPGRDIQTISREGVYRLSTTIGSPVLNTCCALFKMFPRSCSSRGLLLTSARVPGPQVQVQCPSAGGMEQPTVRDLLCLTSNLLKLSLDVDPELSWVFPFNRSRRRLRGN